MTSTLEYAYKIHENLTTATRASFQPRTRPLTLDSALDSLPSTEVEQMHRSLVGSRGNAIWQYLSKPSCFRRAH